jgi:hypothetical protein
MAAILFVAVMMTTDAREVEGILERPAIIMGALTAEARGLECSDHSECGEDVYCINGSCEACVEDPTVCLDAEFCQYPDECFCDETWGICKEGLECVPDGYPQSGLGYCSSCDDVWHLCPTSPFEYWCSWLNECKNECSDRFDCPNPNQFVCNAGDCVWIG